MDEISNEAAQGFNYAQGSKVIDSRKQRRNTIAVIKKILPVVHREVLATQEAFEKNFPGKLDSYTDDDRFELLEGDNQTREALFYRRLFSTEMYYSAMQEYLRTGGKTDILRELGMSLSAQELEEVLKKDA